MQPTPQNTTSHVHQHPSRNSQGGCSSGLMRQSYCFSTSKFSHGCCYYRLNPCFHPSPLTVAAYNHQLPSISSLAEPVGPLQVLAHDSKICRYFCCASSLVLYRGFRISPTFVPDMLKNYINTLIFCMHCAVCTRFLQLQYLFQGSRIQCISSTLTCY